MQTFDLSFTGLDTDCASGAGSAAADPWTSVAYTSADGTLTTTLSVDTGGAASDVLGRAFVVHGYDGGRIACALLTEGPVLTASGFVPYPSYAGELAVTGSVTVTTSAT